MKDALLLEHMQDVVTSLGDVEQAVRLQKPPDVKVDVPPQQVVVNVPQPLVINKAADSPAPVVNVTVPVPVINIDNTLEMPPQKLATFRVVVTGRDENGLLSAFTIEQTS